MDRYTEQSAITNKNGLILGIRYSGVRLYFWASLSTLQLPLAIMNAKKLFAVWDQPIAAPEGSLTRQVFLSYRNLPTGISTPSPFFLARSSRALSRSSLNSVMLPSTVGERHMPLPTMRRRTVSCQATEWSENNSGQTVGRVMARSSSLGHEDRSAQMWICE